jgi:hypothetical protein
MNDDEASKAQSEFDSALAALKAGREGEDPFFYDISKSTPVRPPPLVSKGHASHAVHIPPMPLPARVRHKTLELLRVVVRDSRRLPTLRRERVEAPARSVGGRTQRLPPGAFPTPFHGAAEEEFGAGPVTSSSRPGPAADLASGRGGVIAGAMALIIACAALGVSIRAASRARPMSAAIAPSTPASSVANAFLEPNAVPLPSDLPASKAPAEVPLPVASSSAPSSSAKSRPRKASPARRLR